jgi:hypothetical protein
MAATTDRTARRSRQRLVAVAGVGAVLIYLVGFHGEYHSSTYEDGTRYTRTQYFAMIRLWEMRGSHPAGLPGEPPSPNAVPEEARYWRGFGFLWQARKGNR